MIKFNLRTLLLSFLLASLVACGFQLRGAADVAFSSIYIQGNKLLINKKLVRSLNDNGVKVLPTAEGAELLLETVGEESEKRILSLAGTGTVNEFELYYRIHYRTKLTGSELWSPTQTVESRRDFTYSDADLLAKQGEEKRLYESMQQDVLRNLMRRLSTIKK
jgi:LPS-assembly lipoprotein